MSENSDEQIPNFPPKKVKADPKDKLICEFCGKTYTRHNRAQHRKSNACKAWQKANSVIKDTLLVEDREILYKKLLTHPYEDENGNIVYLSDAQIKFYSKIPNRKFTPVKQN